MAREAISIPGTFNNYSGTYDAGRNSSELGTNGLAIYEQMGFGGSGDTIGNTAPAVGGSTLNLSPVITRANETLKQFAPSLTVLIGLATLIILFLNKK